VMPQDHVVALHVCRLATNMNSQLQSVDLSSGFTSHSTQAFSEKFFPANLLVGLVLPILINNSAQTNV